MTIESIFMEALKRGPVILLDNMHDKTHAGTMDPLVKHSPLIRLAILAVDLGADPDLLWFGGKVHPRWSAAAVMYDVGADCPELDSALRSGIPTIGFHYCSLNAMYFVDEIGVFGQRIKAGRCKDDNPNVTTPVVWIEPQSAKFDRGNPKHLRVSKRGRGVIAQLSAQGKLGALEIAGTSLEITYKFWRSLTDDTFCWSQPTVILPKPAAEQSAKETREAKRAFAEHIIVTDGIRDANARTAETPVARAEITVSQNSEPRPVRDLDVGQPVELANANNAGVRTWWWTILSKPERSMVADKSSSSRMVFTPDVPGDYVVLLQVNESWRGQTSVVTLHVAEFASAADQFAFSRPSAGRSIATVAAFVQRHTYRTTSELAAMSSADLLDLADRVLKQDRQQAHEEMTGRIEALMKERDALKERAEEAETEVARLRKYAVPTRQVVHADPIGRTVSVIGGPLSGFTNAELDDISRDAMEARQMREVLSVQRGDGTMALHNLRARAEKAETKLQIIDMDDIGDALKRAKTAETEAKHWHDRWQTHDNAITDITQAYFDGCLGPTPATSSVIVAALRRYAEVNGQINTLAVELGLDPAKIDRQSRVPEIRMAIAKIKAHVEAAEPPTIITGMPSGQTLMVSSLSEVRSPERSISVVSPLTLWTYRDNKRIDLEVIDATPVAARFPNGPYVLTIRGSVTQLSIGSRLYGDLIHSET